MRSHQLYLKQTPQLSNYYEWDTQQNGLLFACIPTCTEIRRIQTWRSLRCSLEVQSALIISSTLNNNCFQCRMTASQLFHTGDIARFLMVLVEVIRIFKGEVAKAERRYRSKHMVHRDRK